MTDFPEQVITSLKFIREYFSVFSPFPRRLKFFPEGEAVKLSLKKGFVEPGLEQFFFYKSLQILSWRLSAVQENFL